MIAKVILGVAIVGTISSTIVLAVLGAVQFQRSARLERKACEKLPAKMTPVTDAVTRIGLLIKLHGSFARIERLRDCTVRIAAAMFA